MEPDQILEIVVHVIAICSIVAAVTPTPVDNAILLAIRKVIDAGALNVLFAKKKDKN